MKVVTTVFGEFNREVALKDAVYASIQDDADRDRMLSQLVEILADKGLLTENEIVQFLSYRYGVKE